MEEHLIIYIDLIGFSEATRIWDESKMEALTNMLHNFAELSGEFSASKIPAEGGGHQLHLRPEITTFSDHIVMSYPIKKLKEFEEDNSIGLTLILAQGLIGALASEALNLGFLIRGGVTIGNLYHQKRVVIGEAMTEAYELESRVAVYPRIVVSRKVYSREGGGIGVIKDTDGIRYLDYYVRMVLAGGGQPGDEFKIRLRAWYANVTEIISKNIQIFEEKEDWNKLAKWVWIEEKVKRVRSMFPTFFE
jgi:hypothetical protein